MAYSAFAEYEKRCAVRVREFDGRDAVDVQLIVFYLEKILDLPSLGP